MACGGGGDRPSARGRGCRYRRTNLQGAAIGPIGWTGCYLGGHAGLAAGHTTWMDVLPIGTIDATMIGQTANTDMSGGIYGGQIGCDYQFSVIGIEGAMAGSTLTGTNMDQFNSTWTLRSRVDRITDVTGRLGYAVDRMLVYGRGGIAWAHNSFEIENTAILDGMPSTTRRGWVVGGGVEWFLAPSWSVFAEADYYNFNTSNVFFVGDTTNPTPPFTVKTTQTIETFKFGVNYRFGSLTGLLGSRY